MQGNFFEDFKGSTGKVARDSNGNLVDGAVRVVSFETLAPQAVLLRNFLGVQAPEVMRQIELVAQAAPFRHMSTPGGFRMSVAMTNCGKMGWISDRRGYRYSPIDPQAGKPWPAMPAIFSSITGQAALQAGFPNFDADVCLINRYEAGARLTLHQDKDEPDLAAPIVSVSLGLPATFQWGGASRKERPVRYQLLSGDVVVWGGVSRLNYHGVTALKGGDHPLTGAFRYNLTFRKSC